MEDRKLARVGIVGTIVTAVCCFTPVLAILLAALGIAALADWLDLVLLPALAAFVGITMYALWRKRGTA